MFNYLWISQVEDYALATILDPRFKNFDFPHVGEWMDGTLTKQTAMGWFLGAWEDPVKGWTTPAAPAAQASTSSTVAIAGEDTTAAPKRKRGLFTGFTSTDSAVGASRNAVMDQRQQYLAMPQLPYERTDVLDFWRVHQHALPDLARMARRANTLPPPPALPVLRGCSPGLDATITIRRSPPQRST